VRGIASVVWQVTLKYMGALIGRQRPRQKMTVAVTAAMHPRICMHILGCIAADFNINRIATSFAANGTRDTQ